MIDFYKKHDFKLFPCKLDKSPNITQPGIGWRDPEAHLLPTEAEKLSERGHLIGAWIPENMIVIDIDKGHKDKEGNPKPDGLEAFKKLCKETGLENQSKSTFVVKTGSGGYHLYYTVPETFSQRQLTTSVDTRTHNGYVIAAGSPGYEVINDVPIAALPVQFQEILRNRVPQKVEKMVLKRPLSADLLQKVLKKINVKHFAANEEWLEFTMSIIATCGNSEDIVDIVTSWSKKDPNYKDDKTLKTRIESYSPNGAITPATFLYILKKEGVSPYYIHLVRQQIGEEFQFRTERVITHYDLPISLNVDQMEDREELARAFFYIRDQASTTRLIEFLVQDKLIYSRSEKQFYFFNGSRWVQWADILVLIYNILVVTADECFVRFAKKDNDSLETLNECLNAVGVIAWRQKIEIALRSSEMISKKDFPWDAPQNKETLTFEDGVLDFSNGLITQRKGRPEEYRRSFIDLPTEIVMNAPEPTNFNKALENIFVDEETRKTAMQALSLAVSGTGKYRKFQIWNGSGKNGKSFLMEVMQKIIGDRAITYNTNLLLQKSRSADDANQVSPGMAKFRGALFACGSETEELKKISQGVVKNITGNETMTARALYQDEVSFQTTFQVVLSTNYLPAFSAYDEAFIDRLLVIPFHTSFYSSEEQKKEFEDRKRKHIAPAQDGEKLMSSILEERAAVVKKLIRTYLDIGNEIYVSKECQQLLALYIDDNNDLGKFLETYCRLDEEGFMSTKYLIDFYNEEHNTRYTTQWISKRLKQLHPELIATRRKVDKTVHRGFLGIILDKNGFAEDIENEEDEF